MDSKFDRLFNTIMEEVDLNKYSEEGVKNIKEQILSKKYADTGKNFFEYQFNDALEELDLNEKIDEKQKKNIYSKMIEALPVEWFKKNPNKFFDNEQDKINWIFDYVKNQTKDLK